MIGKPVLCQIITGKDGKGQQSREMHTVNVTIDTDSVGKAKVTVVLFIIYHYYTPRNEVRGGILESPCPSVCPSVRPSVRPNLGFRRITAFPLHLSS